MRALLAIALAPLLLGGCVFPAQPATGVELSWRFNEVADPSTDIQAAVVRTCAGALVGEVSVTVRDLDDASREHTTEVNCGTGFFSGDDLYIGTTEIYYELRPGTYALELLFADDNSGAPIRQITREIEVRAQIEPVQFEVELAPVGWALGLQNPDACQSASFNFRRADPERDVATPDPPALHGRESHHGLPLDGTQLACADIIPGLNLIDAVRGHYILAVEVDGTSCEYPVTLRTGNFQLDLDLAAPCGP